MSVFTNRHVVVALLVAPILAIIAYFAVDYIVTETPHAAQAGQSYSLVNKPNCRYPSGVCDIENGDMKIRAKPIEQTEDAILLGLTSKVALDAILIDLGKADDLDNGFNPSPVSEETNDGLNWQVRIAKPQPNEVIRVVIMLDEVQYFSELSTAFLLPKDPSPFAEND